MVCYNFAVAFTAFALALSQLPGYAQSTTRVSVATDGTQGNSVSNSPSISADGRFVAFMSAASNFAPGDTNGNDDVFVRDTLTRTTRRVNISTGGTQANGNSESPSISTDGRYVAFASYADNLVPGDTNDWWDVFVRDTEAGTTTRVSITSNGTQANDDSSTPSISADGRYVVFASAASNFVPGDTNGTHDVFLRDTVAGTTTSVSVATDGTQGNGASYFPSISADGRYVAFLSEADNLVLSDTNVSRDVFVRDTVAGTTARVSLSTDGAQSNDDTGWASISANGRCVAFESKASNFVPGDTNGKYDMFVRDIVAGTTTLVSAATDGTRANGNSYAHSISADGRYVAFRSDADNLVPGDTNSSQDAFVRDTVAGTTTRVSVATDGTQGNSVSHSPSISADGRYVAFLSEANNLVPGDTNSESDIFLRGPLVTQAAPYTIGDVAAALQIGAGLLIPTQSQSTYLDTDNSITIDLRDALSIARKVAGLDSNP